MAHIDSGAEIRFYPFFPGVGYKRRIDQVANRKYKTAPPKAIKTRTWLILMALFIVELLSYTWCRVQYVRLGYEIEKETNHGQELKDLEAELKMTVAHLKSPERFAGIARELGLKTPRPKQKVLLP